MTHAAGQTIQGIVTQLKNVTDLINEISAAPSLLHRSANQASQETTPTALPDTKRIKPLLAATLAEANKQLND